MKTPTQNAITKSHADFDWGNQTMDKDQPEEVSNKTAEVIEAEPEAHG